MKFHRKPAVKKITKFLFSTLVVLVAFTLLCSHNLYIKLETYFLKQNQEATLSLYNGTFEESENIIARNRISDASILFKGQRLQIDSSQWADKDSTITQFKFTPIEEGTYVTGVSTKPRNIELSAEKFNNYLKHDGVLDILEHRKSNDLLHQDAVESYQKHVKTIYQVGDIKTDDWKTVLGYPIEFVPESNPYDKYTGDNLEVKLLLDGEPLVNQLVYSDYIKVTHNHDHGDHDHGHKHDDHSHKHEEDGHSHEDEEHNHSHDHDDHDEDSHSHKHDANEEHARTHGKQLKTNDKGIVTITFLEDGIYYLRTIYMVSVSDSDELTHESKWATLTFEVTHSHEDSENGHNDHHDNGLPTWMFILGSAIFIGILFFVFRKKDS